MSVLREVRGLDRIDGETPYLRLACGHAVSIGEGRLRDGILTNVRVGVALPLPHNYLCPLCPEPSSLGADRGSAPTDSAGAVREASGLVGALIGLRALDRHLEERFEHADLPLRERIEIVRAQERVGVAREAAEEALRILHGPQAPADGGAEGGTLDVTSFPTTPSTALGRIIAALLGFREGAGRWPERIRATAEQADAAGVEAVRVDEPRISGIPVEVVDA